MTPVSKLTKNDLVVETFPIGSYACNCSLIYSASTKEALIVDPGNDAVMLMKMVQERGLKVTKLLHTHAHFDHIGQSDKVRKLTGASLHLHHGDLFLYEALPQQGAFFGMKLDPPGKVDSYLQHEEEFALANLNLKLKTVHTPGHTPGSCCFYTEFLDTPLLFAGDTLFHNSIGRTDLPGGDYDTIIGSIKDRLLTMPGETQVITGHGPDTTIHREEKQNPFLT